MKSGKVDILEQELDWTSVRYLRYSDRSSSLALLKTVLAAVAPSVRRLNFMNYKTPYN